MPNIEHANEFSRGSLTYGLEINPAYKEIVPKMSESEYCGLRDSIKANGQLMPILVNEDRVVLDGHHRLRVCLELGIVPKIKVLSLGGGANEIAFIIRTNLQRRHLNTFQRIEVAYLLEVVEILKAKERRMATLQKGNTPSSLGQNDPNEEKGRVIDVCARAAGVSANTYRKGREIIRLGSETLKERVTNGELTIEGAYRRLAMVEGRQEQQAFRGKVKQVSDSVRLIDGEFKDVTESEVPSKSVDFILYNYLTENSDIGDYAHLARFAARVLKPGGIVAMSVLQEDIEDAIAAIKKRAGKMKLIRIFVAICSSYDATGTTDTKEGELEIYLLYSELVDPSAIRSDFKEFLDVRAFIRQNDELSEMEIIQEYLIRHLTLEKGVVCYPRCEAASDADVAIKLGRQFLGIDRDLELLE